MYPSFSPPTLYVNGTEENGGTFTPGAALTMAATTGTIYYTTDGSDPRAGSTDFTVSSITLSGTTATVTLDGASTGLYNGETIYIGGAAQTAYDGSFTIANVTVEFHRRDDHLHLHGERFARLARHAAGRGVAHRRHHPAAAGSARTAQAYTGAITLTQGETDQCPRLFREHLRAP